jgi:hypothetical protein
MNSPGVMKAEMIEADFEDGTLKFRAVGEYYARAGYFYLVPNTVYEDMLASRERLSNAERILRDVVDRYYAQAHYGADKEMVAALQQAVDLLKQ